jgi:UDP-3-O-[3-hydroxymyristoyl] glucosamine N-acyltransferase
MPGTKLDNLIQIAHNVKVGAHCAFAAQTGISGSTTIGNGVLMGGQSAIAGHLSVGDRAKLSGRSGVTKDVPAGVHVTGYPAGPHEDKLNEYRNLKALPRLRKTVKDLQQRLETLEKSSEKQDSAD